MWRTSHTSRLLFALAINVFPVSVGGQVFSLDDLAFMSGCWLGPAGEETAIEEFYSSPSDNLMVGTTRYLRNGKTVMFEFAQITVDSTGIVLLPYPRGRASADAFRLTTLEDGHAIFEAPEHDFPKRIIYRREGADVRIARIDGGEGSAKVQEWRMERVACPAG